MTPRVLIAPFFRASVTVGADQRRLLVRDVDTASFLNALCRAGAILRQNLRRLFAAALLAESCGGRLVFVEGWRSNRIVRLGSRRERIVTGTWIFRLLLRLLQRRGLVDLTMRPVHAQLSRCTWEEARGIASVADSLPTRPSVIGVSDTPCPSAARAARYVRCYRPDDAVVTPREALARSGVRLSPAQAAFWDAVRPRAVEAMMAPWIEAPNWAVHWLSTVTQALTGMAPSLEQRLAAALRRDR